MPTPDLTAFQTPFYLIDEAALIRNLTVLQEVIDASGCRILLAQKAFSLFAVYPLISRTLHGVAASGLYEARLGFEAFGKETHVFSPAYQDHEFDALLRYSDTLIFNSFSQWRRFRSRALQAGKQCGIRVNPQRPTQATPLYDPCTADSRLGVPPTAFDANDLAGISGLHVHCLCEQNTDALASVLQAFEASFGAFLPTLSWVNLGGGHHITRADYNLPHLVELIRSFSERTGLVVYLEPGEAIALNAGTLVTSVVDVLEDPLPIAICDTSATCHMPDVLEMPYRPEITGAGLPGEKAYTVRLGGPTCLAGDIIGDYSFDRPLQVGDRLVFHDMAIYTMVKNNTFNGMKLPDIVLKEKDGHCRMIRQFGYHDFKTRLS